MQSQSLSGKKKQNRCLGRVDRNYSAGREMQSQSLSLVEASF